MWLAAEYHWSNTEQQQEVVQYHGRQTEVSADKHKLESSPACVCHELMMEQAMAITWPWNYLSMVPWWARGSENGCVCVNVLNTELKLKVCLI